jgi:transposase InsO family protein
MSRAVAWFNSQGVECRQVISDNGPDFVSRSFAKACKVLGLRHICTRPYTPRTNGEAERFIPTLCREWAYGNRSRSSEERNRWLPRYQSIYNSRRCHLAIGGRTPLQQRLNELLRRSTCETKSLGT